MISKKYYVGSRKRANWMMTVGRIDWPNESFWRLGICSYGEDYWTERAHLRFPCEAAAMLAVEWLTAVALAGGR